ncbi:MAG: hypothetical protein HFI37_01375 [Lachnospiraceae bacterium]|nr:hypothetical protein [Lachnospiraceae bacterium]
MNRGKVRYIIFTIFAVMFFVSFPFFLELLLTNINKNPIGIRFALSKETWFGFIASYMGAIGTVVLGIIAIWQNKRYKELSDKSSEEVKHIQQELKILNERTVNAIETLEKIEVAIYHPSIEKIPYNFYGVRKTFLDEKSQDICGYQINYLNVTESDLLESLDKLMDKYKTYGFGICNVGEKAIRNFNCNSIKIDGKTPGFRVSNPSDVIAGESIYILFINLPLKAEITQLEMEFEFYTLLMDRFVFQVEVIINYEENDFSVNFINFETPHKKSG